MLERLNLAEVVAPEAVDLGAQSLADFVQLTLERLDSEQNFLLDEFELIRERLTDVKSPF